MNYVYGKEDYVYTKGLIVSRIFADKALLASGWAQNVRLHLSGSSIEKVESGVTAKPDDVSVNTLLPALSNLHSHTFQRAMAGMTEYRSAGKDSFWTWRELMYRFLEHLTPEQVEAIAALVFMEMQEAGYASVGEFHYVHHQAGGEPYSELSELSGRIFAAAEKTGIGLTHLPVLYSYGGAGEKELSGGQLRFGNDVERFNQLVEEVKNLASAAPEDFTSGIAPHSLRATSPDDLREVLDVQQSGPVHIHVAEQPKEVEEISAWLNSRPVQWLLDNCELDHRWCLIHAIHMNEAETVAMARSGVVAGLCPITESNLGDGPFNGATYLSEGGIFGVGSDSNVRISLSEELRTLEYSQRLRDFARNVLVAGEGSVGHTLYTGAASGGAQALQRKSGKIEQGMLADLVAINSQAPSLCALRDDQLLDGFVFASSDEVVTDVWSAGRHKVSDGRHVARDEIIKSYKLAVTGLLNTL